MKTHNNKNINNHNYNLSILLLAEPLPHISEAIQNTNEIITNFRLVECPKKTSIFLQNCIGKLFNTKKRKKNKKKQN